ncbi:MAG TPA: DUF4352 domain-containing protein [Cerasibacillus sp.]|uniref:DUF4352 domain-containing protein n=1 Tax=Cerasibacillus sp. TaxID=2498711 RepID=UPI002F3F0D48
MKRMVQLIFVILISISLIACSTKNGEEAKESDNNVVNEENNDGKDNEDADSKDNDGDSGKSSSEITTEDQLDLKLGDTGKFDTTLGTYEMTVESAELLEELDGKEAQFDYLILIDLKLKNTSDHDLDVDDIMTSLEVTDNLEGSVFFDASPSFDSVEVLTGTIQPGEEISGQFITEAYEADEYYFREDPGNVAAGGSNQVIWTIPADEAK